MNIISKNWIKSTFDAMSEYNASIYRSAEKAILIKEQQFLCLFNAIFLISLAFLFCALS